MFQFSSPNSFENDEGIYTCLVTIANDFLLKDETMLRTRLPLALKTLGDVSCKNSEICMKFFWAISQASCTQLKFQPIFNFHTVIFWIPDLHQLNTLNFSLESLKC